MENGKSASDSIIRKEEDNHHPEESENIAGVGLNDDDDDQKEEEKIDKFFDLIRSFREARDRRRNELIKELATNANIKKKRKCIDNKESGWVPTFEWEDFLQPIPLGGVNNVIFNKEEDGESGLDLKLTL